jgi:two-component system response regulator RegA
VTDRSDGSPEGVWLVVDDDVVFARTLATALERRGHRVAIAHEQTEALACVDALAPTRIVLDLRLGAESGLRLLPELRRRAPNARIVVLTAFGSIASAVHAVKEGADDYLLKPVAVRELIAAFEPDAVTVGPEAATMSTRRVEWEHIQRVLAEEGGNVSRTAERLGIHRRTLQRKLAKKAPLA